MKRNKINIRVIIVIFAFIVGFITLLIIRSLITNPSLDETLSIVKDSDKDNELYASVERDKLINSTADKYYQQGYMAKHLETQEPIEILYSYNDTLIAGKVKIPNIQYASKFRNEGSTEAILIEYKNSTLTIWGYDKATLYFNNGEDFSLSDIQHGDSESIRIKNDIYRIKQYNSAAIKYDTYNYLAKSESTDVCYPSYIPCYKKGAIEDYDEFGTVVIFAGINNDLSEAEKQEVLSKFDEIVRSLELEIIKR